MTSPIQILLVEDDPTWQHGIRALLSSEPRFQLVAVADTYDGALQRFHQHKPDLVLLDWQILGEQDGLDVGRALEESGFTTERIILISGADPHTIPENPYLLIPKPHLATELLPTIQTVTKN